MWRKFTLLFLTAAFWWGIAETAGAAHGVDPASDVLSFENVYFPAEPKVCPELKRGLTRLTDDAKQADYPVKVALIASESDLGEIPQVFGRPQEYAEFLYGQTGGQIDGVVLIAMPGGFGLAPREPEATVLDEISIPDDADPSRLARAAVEAIPRLAEAAGQSVEKPDIGSCSKGSGSSSLIFIVPVALLFLAGAAIALGRRGSRRPTDRVPPATPL